MKLLQLLFCLPLCLTTFGADAAVPNQPLVESFLRALESGDNVTATNLVFGPVRREFGFADSQVVDDGFGKNRQNIEVSELVTAVRNCLEDSAKSPNLDYGDEAMMVTYICKNDGRTIQFELTSTKDGFVSVKNVLRGYSSIAAPSGSIQG